MSDDYAVTHDRKVLAAYSPRYGLIKYGNQSYAVGMPFYKWIRSLTPLVSDYVRHRGGPTGRAVHRPEVRTLHDHVRIQARPNPLPVQQHQ